MDVERNARERERGRRILRERAVQMATPREDLREGDRLEILVFRLGGSRFGLETSGIAEVFPSGAWTGLPGSPPELLGIVHRRGRILPVVDPSRLLGLPPLSQSQGFLLLVNAEPSAACIPVESLDSILGVDLDSIFPPPSTMEKGIARFLRGVLRDGTALLDARALLSDDSMIF